MAQQAIHSIMIDGQYTHAFMPEGIRRSGNQKPRNGGGAYDANYSLAHHAASVRVYSVADALAFYKANAANPHFQRADIDTLDPDGKALPIETKED